MHYSHHERYNCGNMLNEAERTNLLIIQAKASSKVIDARFCLLFQNTRVGNKRETTIQRYKVGFYANAFLLNEFNHPHKGLRLRISQRGLGLQPLPGIYYVSLGKLKPAN